MLDLSLTKKKYYKLKWFDGKELQINPPSQKLFVRMMQLKDSDENNNADEVVTELVDIAKEIVSNNVNGLELDFSCLTFDISLAIIKDYLEFFTEQVSKTANFH